jgi:hypothetical protein
VRWLEDAEKGKIGRLIDWPHDGASGHVTVALFGDSEVVGSILFTFIFQIHWIEFTL